MKVSSETKTVVTITLDQDEAGILMGIANNTDWNECSLAHDLYNELEEIEGVEYADQKATS